MTERLIRIPEFVREAEALHSDGRTAEAERVVREGLGAQPDCVDAVLLLARLLLESDRGDDALREIECYAAITRDEQDSGPAAAAFGTEVSDNELDVAFAEAEPEREQMFDADAVAATAIRQTDGDFPGAFEFAESSFATRTVAGLLEEQGDVNGASAIRERVDTSESNHSPAASRRQRRQTTIAQLERWLSNLQGGIR